MPMLLANKALPPGLSATALLWLSRLRFAPMLAVFVRLDMRRTRGRSLTFGECSSCWIGGAPSLLAMLGWVTSEMVWAGPLLNWLCLVWLCPGWFPAWLGGWVPALLVAAPAVEVADWGGLEQGGAACEGDV